jgi:4-hydroxybenzoate polyprenyltransferase
MKMEHPGERVGHVDGAGPALRSYVEALRPHQWVKNAFVFLPMLAGHRLDGTTFLVSLAAFAAFCLFASSAYVINDLFDLAADRMHPRKCHRPLASGRIPTSHGRWMVLGLLVPGVAMSMLLGWAFLLVMLAYLALTTAYSVHLKRQIAVDICILAALYTIRIGAGGVATEIPLSFWLLAFSMFFFFSLAAVKRQAELVDLSRRVQVKAAGRGYHADDLPIVSMIALGSGYVSVLVMALYVSSPAVVELYTEPAALWGICCVLIYWITRVVLITHRGAMHDDPVIFAIKDRVSQVSLLLVLCFALAGSWL